MINYILFVLFFLIGYYFIKNRKFLSFLLQLLSATNKERKRLLQHAQFINKKEQKDISIEEKFALQIGEIEHARILKKLNQDYDLDKYLKKEWKIKIKKDDAKEKLLYVLQQIWSQGTLSSFMRSGVLHAKLEIKDLIAFDSARFSELIQQALYLELIDEKEAWGLLFLNAQRVQDSFISTEEFINSYYKGSLFYVSYFKTKDKKMKQKNAQFDDDLRELICKNTTQIMWLKTPLFDKIKINEMEY